MTATLKTVRLSDLRPSARARRPHLSLDREVTWEELATREPRLQVLLDRARRFHDRRLSSFCANAVWYGGRGLYRGYPGLRRELLQLVGWLAESDDPVVCSRQAYELAYETVYRALPDCGAGCICSTFVWRPSPDDPGPAGVRRAFGLIRRQVAPLVFDRDGWMCVICGTPEELTVDHITPVALGGTNEFDNFQTLCRSCNSRKGTREVH